MSNAKIQKSASIGALTLSDEELEKINLFSLVPLKADEIFPFKIAVCSNAQDTDRDNEPFLLQAVKDLAKHIEGKTMILDHNPSAKNQIARIYDTELITSDEKTEIGEPLTTLEVRCYMVRTEKNSDLIAEIKAGIKKEVSVGFSTSGAAFAVKTSLPVPTTRGTSTTARCAAPRSRTASTRTK